MLPRSDSGESEYSEESFESDSVLHRAPSMEDEIVEEINSIAALNAKDRTVAAVVEEVEGLDELVRPDTSTPQDTEAEEPPEAEELQSKDFFADENSGSPGDFAALPTNTAAAKHTIFPTPPTSDTSSIPLLSPRQAQHEAQRREIELQQAKQRYQYYCTHSIVSDIEQSMQQLPHDHQGIVVPKFNDICSPRGLLTGRSSPRIAPEQLPKIPPKMKFTTAYDEKTGLFGVDLKGERLSKLENYILQRNNRRNNDLFEILVAREHLHRSKPKKYNEGTLLHDKKIQEQLIHSYREDFDAWSEAMKRVKSTQIEAEKFVMANVWQELHHPRSKSSGSTNKQPHRVKKKKPVHRRSISSKQSDGDKRKSDHVSFAPQTKHPTHSHPPHPKRRGTPLALPSLPDTPASASQPTERNVNVHSDAASDEEHYESDFEEPPKKINQPKPDASAINAKPKHRPTPPEQAPKPTQNRPLPKHVIKPSPAKATPRKSLPKLVSPASSPAKPAKIVKPKRPIGEQPAVTSARIKHTTKDAKLPAINAKKDTKPKKLLAIKKPLKNYTKPKPAATEDDIDVTEIEQKIAALKNKIVSGNTKSSATPAVTTIVDSPLYSDVSSVFPHLNSVSTLDSLGFTTTYNETSVLPAAMSSNQSNSELGIASMPSIVESSANEMMEKYEEEEFESLDSDAAAQPVPNNDTDNEPVEVDRKIIEEEVRSKSSDEYVDIYGGVEPEPERVDKSQKSSYEPNDAYEDSFETAPSQNRSNKILARLDSDGTDAYEDSYEEFEGEKTSVELAGEVDEVKQLLLNDEFDVGDNYSEASYSNEFD